MRKRILAAFLAAVMIATGSVPAYAAETENNVLTENEEETVQEDAATELDIDETDLEALEGTYIIYYSGNGGKGSMAATTAEFGKAVKLSANLFTYEGYRFAGWNTKDDGSGTYYGPEEEVIDLVRAKNGTIVLYAQWIDASSLVVTFDANGGNVSVTEKYVRIGSVYGVMPLPTLYGYRFTGWSLSPDESELVTETTTVTLKTDHTLYARWAEDEVVHIYVGDEEVTDSEIDIKPGDAGAVTLTAQITPLTSKQEVTWSSLDTSKVVVDEKGVVKGIVPGYAFVTAVSKEKPSKTARVRIHVIFADPEKVDVSGNDVIRIGQEEKYKAVVSPVSASQTVEWSLGEACDDNGEMADPEELADLKVYTSGNTASLTAKKTGKVTLVASSEVDSIIFDTLEIRILAEIAEEIKIFLAEGSRDEITVGEKSYLQAVVSPATAPQNVRWESNNEAVATVDSEGAVTGVSRGTAYIYAISQDSDSVRGSFRIRVNEPEAVISYLTVDGNVVTGDPIPVDNGKGLTFIAYDASGKEVDVTWSVENADRAGNASYATISGRGYLKAILADSYDEVMPVKVTARVITGTQTASALVHIIPAGVAIKQIPAVNVYFDKTTATIYANGSTDNYINLGQLVHVVGKNNAEPTNPGLVWTSSNTTAAEVDYCGVVTALSTNGKARATSTITATTIDGSEKKATFKIVVENRPVELTIVSAKDEDDIYASSNGNVDYYFSKLTLGLGKSFTVKSVISPVVVDNEVTFKSFNTEVATISAKGKIKAKKIGSAIIVATTKTGGLTASFKVTVTSPAKSVKLNKKTLKLGAGNKYQLEAVVQPLQGSQKCSFESSDTDVARVDENTGLVTALSEGTAYITATSFDGNKRARCKVTVGKPVNSIEITGKTDCVAENKTLKLIPKFNGGEPEDAPINKEVIWSIEEGVGSGAATINSKTGVLKGISKGTVRVRATCALDGTVYGISDYIMVYVPVKKASLNKKSVTMYANEMYRLKVTIVPDTKDSSKTASLRKAVTYSLQNPEDSAYVTVDASSGLITALKKTSKPVVVVATYTPYGSKEKTLKCKVTVK
ncbi:Ig-like domain-containing protein [Butyrivibrio sp. MC2021]|uniref:Ig-like domain-containing protein n=1 Tax=Butyrivibrio sp. MC2021 TaxID=1408306 RepID=UPI0004796CC4|nr:Ig-like domain-containing protein [Butyrivibrio sp. MC2021]